MCAHLAFPKPTSFYNSELDRNVTDTAKKAPELEVINEKDATITSLPLLTGDGKNGNDVNMRKVLDNENITK